MRQCPPGWLCHPVLQRCQSSIDDSVVPEPHVGFVSPKKGAEKVALRPVILLAFTLAVDAASVAARLHLEGGPAVALVPQNEGSTSTLEFAPATDLAPETTYTLRLDAGVIPAVSGARASTEPFSTRFATDKAPDVTPPDAVSGLVVERRSDTVTALSWKAPADAAGVMVLRRKGAPVRDGPLQGVSYGAGTLLGDSEVVQVTSLSSVVDTDPSSGLYDYAVFTFDGVNNYSTGRRAPLVMDATFASCAGTGAVTVTSSDEGAFRVLFSDTAGALPGTLYPLTAAPFSVAVDIGGAPLTPGKASFARIVADGPAGRRIDLDRPYTALAEKLAVVREPLPVGPGGTAQLLVARGGWSSFEAEVDADPLPGVERWTSASVVDAATSPVSARAAIAGAGKYKLRARPTKATCPVGAWTESAEFAVGKVFYASPQGSDAKSGADPANARLTLLSILSPPGPGPGTDVFVAVGDYREYVTVGTGVRLFGGYDPTFRTRVDPRVAGASRSRLIPDGQAGVAVNGDASTLLDGFEIDAPNPGTNSPSEGVLLSGAAVVSHSRIHGGQATSQTSRGIATLGAGAVQILDNEIDDGGSPGSSFGIDLGSGAGAVIKGNKVLGVVGIRAYSLGVLIEGNTVTMRSSPMSNGDERVGIDCGGRSFNVYTVRNNVVGTDGLTSPVNSTGIRLSSPSTGRVEGNVVHGGRGKVSHGLAASAGELVNNVVHGGEGPDSVGILVETGTVLVANNTVFAGTGTTAAALRVESTGGEGVAALTNNLCFGAGTSWIGIDLRKTSGAAARLRSLQNNVFLGVAGMDAPRAVLRDASGAESATAALAEAALCAAQTPSERNALVALAPALVFTSLGGPDTRLDTLADDDWSLATSDAQVTRAGRDASDAASFQCGVDRAGCAQQGGQRCGAVTVDRAGAARTAPFSVGAYESTLRVGEVGGGQTAATLAAWTKTPPGPTPTSRAWSDTPASSSPCGPSPR